MPIPFFLVAAGLAAGAIGAGGHISAKETNEKAERIAQDARRMYNGAKSSLEKSQNETEEALLKLGYLKKEALDNSIKLFIRVYERVKDIKLKDSVGLNELSKFSVDSQDVLQMREMSDIYQSAFKSGTAGAAAGTVVALAASGSLSIVAGELAFAGSLLGMGELGLAAGVAGSGLAFAASVTPLAAVAAPVLLFTGLSASSKADENLEKAETMYEEAELAVEKMKISETLCQAITERSDMFSDLLQDLDRKFNECTILLDKVTQKKIGLFKNKRIESADLTEEETKLIWVTYALAGAVKSVIDTPILTKEGTISDSVETIYDDVSRSLPDLEQQVAEVTSYNYDFNANRDLHSSKAENARGNIQGQKAVTQGWRSTWWGKLLILIAAVFGIMFVLNIVISVLIWSLPVLIPILLIVFVVRMVKKR